jgi:uncharacterized protein (DUF488 family)
MTQPTDSVVLTIGHSSRSLEDFISLLQAHGVTCVADVRKIPRSRHNPQFNQETLPAALGAAGIGYVALPALSGRRRRQPDSRNAGWRNPSFQGYADYMQTEAFAAAIDQLLELARQERVALMCAEAVPWRCHRSLIADALTVRGVRVEDILSASRRTPHRLTPWARVEGTRIFYPPEMSAIADTR